MSIRLIALDMDGTLLNPAGKLTKRTIEALRQARARGVVVTLSSGRMPCALRPFVQQLQIDAPLICYNGALVADSQSEKAISALPLSVSLAREIAACCEERQLHIQAYRGDAFVCAEHGRFAQDYLDFLKGSGRLEVTNAPLSQSLDFETPKMLAIDTPERIAALLPDIQARFAGRVRVATSQPRFIEFVSPQAGKAAALNQLSQAMGLRRDEVAAFGDGLNDLDMIEWAGTGVAMANGAREVIEKADCVAPSNAEDGVAQMVEAMMKDGRIEEGTQNG